MDPAQKTEKAQAEYDSTFLPFDVAVLRSRALNGQLVHSGIRSIFWKVLLGALSDQSNEMWIVEIASERKSYEGLKDIYVGSGSLEGKLKEVDAQQRGEDERIEISPEVELIREIRQDIERTYPDELFFEDEATRNIMWNVLFIYSKENQDVSYKQGMHELLAVIIYLLDREKLKRSEEIVSILLDENFLEHDAYIIFEKLMKNCKDWFIFSASFGGSSASISFDRKGFLSVLDSSLTRRIGGTDHTASPIVKKCHYIQNTLLKSRDPALYKTLCDLEIEPQIYGLKWIRLLFAREFNLNEILVVWDGLFAGGISDMVNFVCLALLLRAGPRVIGQDYMTALREIFAPPETQDPHEFIEEAIKLRDMRSSGNFSLISSFSSAMRGMENIRNFSQQRIDQIGHREGTESASEANTPEGKKVSTERTKRVDSDSQKHRAIFLGWQQISISPNSKSETNDELLTKEVDKLKAIQSQMAVELQRNIDVLHAELVQKGEGKMDIFRLQYALAELKKVKNVLAEEIEYDPYSAEMRSVFSGSGDIPEATTAPPPS